MCVPLPLVEPYELILQQLERMQSLASSGDWMALVQEASLYVMNIEAMKRDPVPLPESEGAQSYRRELLERIVVLDADIRAKLVARRDELGKLLGQADPLRAAASSSAKQRSSNAAMYKKASAQLGKPAL